MKTKRLNLWTRERLMKFGLPAVLIPGMLLAISLGWNPTELFQSKDYYTNTVVFPKSGIVNTIIDGDTFTLVSGVEVRLLGINAPGRGEAQFEESSESLRSLISAKRVYLEYDRYQDDKYGRILAWVWTGCESIPSFLPADYMHLSDNASRKGLMDNPEGCKEGKLINESMVDSGNAIPIIYTDRGELKYEKRLKKE